MRLQYELSATGANQIRAVLRGVEKEAQASNRRMATDAQRTARQQTAAIRAHEKALLASERARLRESLASSKAEARGRLADEKALARAKESLDRQRSRALIAHHKTEDRARRSMMTSLGRGAATGTREAVGGAVRLGGATLGLAGGFAAANAMAEESNVRRQASQLANQAGDPSLKGALATESTSVRGLSGSEVLAGQSAFVGKTGDLNTSRQIKGSMGELSLATGADFTDLMETVRFETATTTATSTANQ